MVTCPSDARLLVRRLGVGDLEWVSSMSSCPGLWRDAGLLRATSELPVLFVKVCCRPRRSPLCPRLPQTSPTQQFGPMSPVGVVSFGRWTARTVEWRRLTSRPWPNVCWTPERLYQCCMLGAWSTYLAGDGWLVPVHCNKWMFREH